MKDFYVSTCGIMRGGTLNMSFEASCCVRKWVMTWSCSGDVSVDRAGSALFVEVVWESVFVVGQGDPPTQTFGHSLKLARDLRGS